LISLKHISYTSILKQRLIIGFFSILFRGDSKTMAVETLRLEELIDVANEERVIDGYGKVNVTDVTWAEVTVEAASDTPIVR
jgi:hypothetical protein